MYTYICKVNRFEPSPNHLGPCNVLSEIDDSCVLEILPAYASHRLYHHLLVLGPNSALIAWKDTFRQLGIAMDIGELLAD